MYLEGAQCLGRSFSYLSRQGYRKIKDFEKPLYIELYFCSGFDQGTLQTLKHSSRLIGRNTIVRVPCQFIVFEKLD